MEAEENNLFDIDRHKLDEEWVKHVRSYHKEATKLADVKRDHSIAKVKLEVTEADLDAEIRSDPKAFNLPEKLTEKVVWGAVVLDKRWKQATYDLIKVKHKLDLQEAVVSALEHKKRGLEKLVDLQLADYFSAPRKPKAERERLEEVEKKDVRRRGRA